MSDAKPTIDLTGKIALVTGAASGIGAAAAVRYAEAGAAVMCADLDGDGARETAEIVMGSGGRAAGLELDVSDEHAVEKSIQQTIDALGGFDILFNNAGIGLAGEVRDLSLEDWRRVVEVNLMGVVHGVHAAYPHMVRQGSGALVNTASGAGLLPRPGMVPYAASKGAVVALSQSLS